MAFCERNWVLLSPTFVSGGSSKVLLNDLPDARCKGILLRFKTQIVQAAGATLITGDQLYRIYDNIRLGEWVRTSGRMLTFLNWQMKGLTLQMPQDVPAAAATYSRSIDVYIPFADYSATSPLDTAIATNLFKDQAIEINWGNVAALFGVNTSFTATAVRAVAYLDKNQPDVLASEPILDYTDWGSPSAQLPNAGGYTHVFLYSESTSALSDLNFASWNVFIDGDNIKPNIQTGELLAEFDIYRAGGVGVLATATGTGGELLPDEPGVAAAATQDLLAIPFIPIISPPAGSAGYSLTHVPIVTQMLRIDWQGVATAGRIAYRRVRLKDDTRVTETLRKMSVANPGQVARATKVGGPGRLTVQASQILPTKVSLSAEDIRRRGGVA
jgi:hypothetical protein